MKKNIYALFILSSVFFVGINFAFAWSAPSNPPPTGTAIAPINTSLFGQLKLGPLGAPNIFSHAVLLRGCGTGSPFTGAPCSGITSLFGPNYRLFEAGETGRHFRVEPDGSTFVTKTSSTLVNPPERLFRAGRFDGSNYFGLLVNDNGAVNLNAGTTISNGLRINGDTVVLGIGGNNPPVMGDVLTAVGSTGQLAWQTPTSSSGSRWDVNGTTLHPLDGSHNVAVGTVDSLGSKLRVEGGPVVFNNGSFSVANGGTNRLGVALNDRITILPGNSQTPLAGKVLTAMNDSGNVEWQPAPTGTTLPTGAVNETLRHDGSNWVANNTLINTGVNVGIGLSPNSLPDVKFDVNLGINDSVEIGSGTVNATGRYSIATGDATTAAGNNSVSFGYGNTANGVYSAVFGGNNTVDGTASFASGLGNNIGTSSTGAVAFGNSNVVEPFSPGAAVFGFQNTVEKSNTFAAGSNNKAGQFAAAVFGKDNNALAQYSMAMGRNITIVPTAANSIGFGLSSGGPWTINQANTFAVVGGNMGVGNVDPTATLDIDGTLRFRGTTTPGQVLTALDSDGNVGWGSGSSSSLWTEVGTNIIHQTDLSRNVGIGTTTPLRKLDVEGGIRANKTSVLVEGVGIGLTSSQVGTGSNMGVNLNGNNAMLDVAGNIRFRGTNVNPPAVGHVLTAIDSSGNATWQSVPAGVSLPVGTTDQTLRYNGSTWVANSLLKNTGGSVEIVTNAQTDGMTFRAGKTVGGNFRGIEFGDNGITTGRLTLNPGELKITTGSPGTGKVLTSLNDDGDAVWDTPSISGSTTKVRTNLQFGQSETHVMCPASHPNLLGGGGTCSATTGTQPYIQISRPRLGQGGNSILDGWEVRCKGASPANVEAFAICSK